MKILHAAETIQGGVATVLERLMVHQATGHEVVAVIPASQRGCLPLVDDTLIRGFNYPKRSAVGLLAFARAFAQAVWHENPDIVHLHSSFAGGIGRLVLLGLWPLRRPKVVYCAHGFGFIMNTGRLKKRIFGWVEWLLQPIADRVVCISRYEATAASTAGLRLRTLRTIYNGIPLGIGNDTSPTQGPLQLLFVGRMDKAKGFDVMLSAMHLLRRKAFHLTAIGAPVQGGSMPEARENVTYTGWLSAPEVQAAMQACDVVVVPSLWEGFGLVAAEAMACGKPVVASDVCALPELVVDGVTGHLFTPGDAELLAKVLQRHTRPAWQRMGRAGRERHAKLFTLDTMLTAYDALYDEVMA